MLKDTRFWIVCLFLRRIKKMKKMKSKGMGREVIYDLYFFISGLKTQSLSKHYW